MQSLGMNPELKTFYSKQLLDRLVPAMEHAAIPYEPTEYEAAVRKWQKFFGDPAYFTEPKAEHEKWDDGYYTAIINSVV